MKVEFEIPFECDDAIRPYLQKVFSGEYDLRIRLPRPPRILDLGANYGSFSIWAHHRWPGCEIIGFEPNPETFRVLERNVSLYQKITVHNYGVGTPGKRKLSHGKNNCGENSFHRTADNPSPDGQFLEVRDPGILPPCDIMKLDIEGCEFEVLEPYIGAGHRPRLILLEYHSHDLLKKINRLLEEDYVLGGGIVENIFGRGVMKYVRKDILGCE